MLDTATGTAPHSASMFQGGDDTIAALATAAGRGAVALIRISGANAFGIAQKVGAPANFAPRSAVRVTVRHPTSGEALDDVLVTHFVGPLSFTGEDVVEISTHGGRVVPASVLVACIAAGARQATPGEFTRRALLNGRIDLLQAEAIQDLVDARTSAMQGQALAQLDGGLSRRLTALRGDILGLEVLLAYDIDFPEEDDGPIAPARVANALSSVRAGLEALLVTAPRAALVRDGALVVIAGPPNAGKSSLFNALLGEARALVTEIPGTTRDAIEALLDTPGLPLRLVDTAGLRVTDDVVERLGIEVSERYVGQAQVVLACAEDEAGLVRTIERVRPLTRAVVVPVLTKVDRVDGAVAPGATLVTNDIPRQTIPAKTLPKDEFQGGESSDGSELLSTTSGDTQIVVDDAPVVHVSAERGTGLQELLRTVVKRIRDAGDHSIDGNAVTITRERHRVAIATALDEIVAFQAAWLGDDVPATIASVHLHSAARELEELVGSVSVEDVLDKLFRDFCVGK